MAGDEQMFTVNPPVLGQLPGRLFGLPGEVVDVVEIICPVCGCDRMETEGKAYKCCDCGMVFIPEYRR